MDFNAIIKRVINLITKPNEEWDTIRNESITIKDLYMKYALILFAIPNVAMFFGMSFSHTSITMALFWAIFFYACTIGTLFLMGVLIDVIGPQFGGSKDTLSAQKLAVFSMVPYALIGALMIFPFRFDSFFYSIMLLSLSSFYLMYIGLPKLKNITLQDKQIPFIAIMVVIWLIVIYIDFRLSGRIASEMFY